MRTSPLYNPRDIERAASDAGSHFFDPDTLRFFGARTLEPVYLAAGGGRTYFVTSERDSYVSEYGPGAWGGQRRYTVRVIAWAAPATIGEPTDGAGFGGYRSRPSAVAAARRFARLDTSGPAAWPCPIEIHAKYSAAEPITGEPDACRACLEEATERDRARVDPLTPELAASAAAILRSAGRTVDTRA